MTDIAKNLSEARQLQRQGRLREAEIIVREVLQQQPRHPFALDLLGMLAQQAGALDDAAGLFEAAAAASPAEPTFPWHLALVRKLQRRHAEARGLVEQALARLAQIRRDGHPQAARFAATLKTELGDFLAMDGDRDGALALFREALGEDPTRLSVWYKLAIAKRFGSVDDEDIQAMTAAAGRTDVADNERAALHFGLGKALDDCGEYERAFDHFRTANELRRGRAERDWSALEGFVAQCEQIFTKEFFDFPPCDGIDSDRPVFVVGMPRSGTTLVEQIVSSHRRAYGAGEQDALQRLLAREAGLNFGAHVEAGFATELDQARAARVASAYLDALSIGAPDEALRVTDKAPSNCYLVGFIALLFPNARIIDCRREALDNCLSMYFQPLPLSYDLAEIGRSYKLYERVMAHWDRVLPGRVLRVNYEEAVSGFESVARRIIEFIGLEWDPQCLDFHRSERAVQTMSLWQVRQPVYTRSVARSRHYAKFLGPLRAALKK
jgi:tetratricopeptide (TPR) repeat protein